MTKVGEIIQEEIKKFSINPTSRIMMLLAKYDHITFKKTILDVLIGTINMKPEQLSTHHTCRFGKWYDAVDDKNLINMQAFKNIIIPHEKIHKLGKQILEHYYNNDFNTAINEVQQMHLTSLEILNLLDEIEKNL